MTEEEIRKIVREEIAAHETALNEALTRRLNQMAASARAH